MTDSNDGTDINEQCPFCDHENIPSRIRNHLYEEHWEEIGALASERMQNDSEAAEPLHTDALDDGYVYVPKEIIEELDLEDDGLVRWFLSDDGGVSIEFDHQRFGVFDDDEMTAPMGGDGQETYDLAGAEQSDNIEESDSPRASVAGRTETPTSCTRSARSAGQRSTAGRSPAISTSIGTRSWNSSRISGSGAGRRAPFLSRERSERQGREERPSSFTFTVWQPVFTS
ncbi:hypothetical protein BRC83_07685 [Halobacteriales archaeon QS_1_68_17]|nr:MAG: hypothetical protein BRC83_07685 [Halobacteriales archaeon QS_1_68_17]